MSRSLSPFKPTIIPSTAFSPLLAFSGSSFTEVWDSLLFCSLTKKTWKCLWKRAFLYNSASSGWDKRWWNPSLKHTTPNKWGVNGRRDALNLWKLGAWFQVRLSMPPSATCIQGDAEAELDGVSQPLQKFPVLAKLSVCPVFDTGAKKCSKRMGGSGQGCRFPHWTCRNGSRWLLLKSFY